MEEISRKKEVVKVKTLAKEHQFVAIAIAGGQWSVQGTSGSWELLSPASSVVVSRTYFDLAGMTLREKTLFFKSALVQDMQNPQHSNGAVGNNLFVYDIMTSSPMTNNELVAFITNGNFADSEAGLTFDETIYGRIRQYVIDVDTAAWGSFVQVSDNQLGSMSPTASDRVYSYRMLFVGAGHTNNIQVTLFAARHILSADVKQEEEFEYLMRLKRSYELQQSYDED